MRKLFVLTILMFSSFALNAREWITQARLEARVDYMHEDINGNTIDSNSGFKGRYLLFRLNGNLADGLSYSFRQRINKPTTNQALFDATDWLMLTYTKGPWSLSAGKQIVGIGGYEYDRSPLDLYFCSEYWNNIACFQFGVSGTYSFSEGKDNLTFQISESPFRRGALNTNNDNILAYNLMWNSSHGWFKSLYSVNMIECMPGRFINYICLGNRFEFGQFACELDIMNRASRAGKFLFSDYSIIGDISWAPIDALTVFVKASYDYNNGVTEDLCVSPGTDVLRAGAGIEYFPLKTNKNVRLHLNCCYTDGRCSATNVLQPGQTIIDAGLTWKMDFLDLKRR